MDYMTELAIEVLPWFDAGATDASAETAERRLKFTRDVEAKISSADRKIWNYASDQARLELLVDRLYGNPSLAQQAVDIIETYPTFIRDLAKAIREEKSNAELLKRVRDLDKHKRDKHSTSGTAKASDSNKPDSGFVRRLFSRDTLVESTDLERALLADPHLVVYAARKLNFAVPFALALHNELHEIAASREMRRRPDTEAAVTRLREELDDVAQAIEEELNGGDAATTDDAGFDSRLQALYLRKKEIEAALDNIMTSQQSERVARDTSMSTGGTPAIKPPTKGQIDNTPFRHPLRAALEHNLFGVALSGGGIRSATFNLGVLQALAEMDVLRQVDYLSTVSGGGYIGSWLAAWIKRKSPDGVRTVQKFLSPARSPNPEAEAVRPIRHLREYSNHITPSTGFLSADTWTMVTVWLRNTVLNQTVLILFLASVLLLPLTVLPAAFQVPWKVGLILASILMLLVSWRIGSNLQSFDPSWKESYDVASPVTKPTPEQKAHVDATRQDSIIKWLVIPMMISIFLFSSVLLQWTALKRNGSLAAGIGAFVLLFVSQRIVHSHGRYYRCFYAHDTPPKGWRYVWAIVAPILFAIVTSALGGYLTTVLAGYLADSITSADRAVSGPEAWRAMILGPPALTLILSTVVVFQIGLLGINFPDERREWWARLAAWFCIGAFAWILLFGIAVRAPFIVIALGKGINTAAALTWVASTAFGVFAAKSGKTGAAITGSLKKPVVREFVSLVAPYVFILGLLIAISIGLFFLLAHHQNPELFNPKDFGATLEALHNSYWLVVNPGNWWYPTKLLVGGAVIGWVLAWRFGVNEFSMHHFYRNRLIRTYLGASRTGGTRKPNRFTGFDLEDDEPLSQLTTNAKTSYVGPYTIVNAALNFVKSDDLAYQERKAHSFVFTPLYCGYEFVDRRPEVKWNPKLSLDGYRPTAAYAYKPDGIHLGTATAISGAAVNPNMGYHSSPAAAFLMTVFNVRLGWWLGNPRHRSGWGKSAPHSGLLYLLLELMGSTNDHRKFINLSDGGHFDNLGVYELVRRRCRFILIADAEQDANLTFGGLGAVVRKCRADFGVQINIRPDRIRKAANNAYSSVHCVTGDIVYPDGSRGKLLYMKSSLTGDEPADVREYHARQPAFPHQSTADQFFDESQFESYRALGYHVTENTLRRGVDALSKPLNTAKTIDIEKLFSYLESIWFPPAPAVQQYAAKHIAAYEALIERVHADKDLIAFDGVLFPGLPKYRGQPVVPAKRDSFYTCTAMMDLMQSVFIDLDLEENSEHPHNAGWIQIFHQWTSHDEFKEAWAITKDTYGERFRRFCQTHLDLPFD
jgi:hypothetical protein